MSTTAERLRTYWGDRQIDRSQLASLAVRHWEIALFAALIGVALGFRLWDLGGRAIHHDESLHMYYAWRLFEGNGYEHVPFMHGPFQFFGSALVFLVWPFRDTDFSARLLYALFGSALVGLPYFFRAYIGRIGALTAALLLAFSPSLLYFSRFARNDIYIAFFTLAMAIVIWRYLKEQKEAYLYAVPLLLMLGFVTKEVSFITTAIFLVYLEVQLTTDLVDKLRATRPMSLFQLVVAYAVLLPTAWLVAAFWPLLAGPRKAWSLDALPAAGHLLIVIGTFSLPLLAPVVQFIGLGDVNLFDIDAERDLRIYTTLLFLVGSAYIGLLWNSRVWTIGAVIFYVPFVLLYTTFFTNMGGFWTGIWGSLDYWLSQQDVRRGSQPDYYYFMTLPVYEFLPLVFALGGALYYAIRGKLEQQLLTVAALIFITVFSIMPEDFAVLGKYHIQIAFVIAIGTVLLLSMDGLFKFLLFWALSMLLALTISGEKMPWLTVHLAVPLVLLAAKVLDDILSPVRAAAPEPEEMTRLEQQARALAEDEDESASFPLSLLTPILAGALLAVIAAVIFQAAGPAAAISIVPWVLSIAALGVVVWIASAVSWRAAGQIAAVALFGALLVFTVRASVTAAFDQGDPNGSPPEMLIYAQGSPSLGILNNEIERLATTSGKGKDLKVIIDDSGNVWPWPWYLRDQGYESATIDDSFSPEPGSVVLISQANQAKLQPFLDQYQDGIPYTHMWWFPELYRGLNVSDFLGDLFRGRLISTWRGYFIDRTVPGASSSADMVAYFPAGFPTNVPTTIGPQTGEPLPAESLTVIGGPGSAAGLFSQPADLAVDSQGNLYVVDSLNHRLQKIAPDGEATRRGEVGTGPGQFANPKEIDDAYAPDGPWGVAIDEDGNIYVADTWNHRIQKFGPDLEFILEWGVGDLFGPRDLAVDADGDVLVVDTGNKRIVKYDSEGKLIEVIGKSGGGRREFNEPTGISIAPNGDVYVADYWNRRVQHFDAAFEYIDEFEVESWGSQGITDRAYIVALSDGGVLATDPANGRMLVFNPSGEEEAAWSLPSEFGASRPVGIAVDEQEEQVYLSDSLAARIVQVPLAVLLTPTGLPPATSGTP